MRNPFVYLNRKIIAPISLRLTKNKLAKSEYSLRDLEIKFRGKNVWNEIVPFDFLIWQGCLWAENVVLVGGFNGQSSSILLDRVPHIKVLQVYEPIPKFYLACKEKLHGFGNRAHLYNEAVFDRQSEVKMEVASDWSMVSETSREIKDQFATTEEIVVRSVNWQTVIDRLPVSEEFSLFMNCEGSEYTIIRSLLASARLPKTIISQTHTTGPRSYQLLYEMRADLCKFYSPLFSADWAWDVWIRKDITSLSAEESERFIS